LCGLFLRGERAAVLRRPTAKTIFLCLRTYVNAGARQLSHDVGGPLSPLSLRDQPPPEAALAEAQSARAASLIRKEMGKKMSDLQRRIEALERSTANLLALMRDVEQLSDQLRSAEASAVTRSSAATRAFKNFGQRARAERDEQTKGLPN